MFTVGLGLLGATAIVLIYKGDSVPVLEGLGFGAALLAMFMRVGGGIFTKAADVGADLVGKVEQGIPEDDPRNAATIADNVGDNAGDGGVVRDMGGANPQVIASAAVLIGIVLAGVILWLTGYFTGTEHKPVKDVGNSSLTGAATVILAGISVGFESAVYTALVIGAAVFGAY